MREVTSIGLISESVMGQSDAKWWLKRAEEDDKSLWDPPPYMAGRRELSLVETRSQQVVPSKQVVLESGAVCGSYQ